MEVRIRNRAPMQERYTYAGGVSASYTIQKIDLVAAAVVRRIFKMYGDGHSPRVIAGRLCCQNLLSFIIHRRLALARRWF